MTSYRLTHWILGCLGAALVFAGCTSDTTSSENSGSLALNLELAEGVEIDKVAYVISGGDMPDMDGVIDVSAPNTTASVEVFGIPPGEGYLVEMAAKTNDDLITCKGDATFDVELGEVTDVMVFLRCKLPETLGGVRVNGKFNVCATVEKSVVKPLQTSVGHTIELFALTDDTEDDERTVIWSSTGGEISEPNENETALLCTEAGEFEVTVSVSDDGFEYCMDSWTTAITCVEGDGNPCDDVTCEDTGNECTVSECDPADGMCKTEDVQDGTECNDGAGLCESGECVDADLCEGKNCDDENECTDDACDPATGDCTNTPVDDGTSCDGGNGMCVEGTCIDNCEGVTCEDTGNECTVAMCNMQTGDCDEMDVQDGTECNDGAGACSAGECVDNNLCEGKDCSSNAECVNDGTCDPADGECIAGDNKPEDTECSENGGAVCDDAGNCVECNSGDQCTGGDQCNEAVCLSNACDTVPVMDGSSCDYQGGDGVCEGGSCVEAPECISPGDCDDGNVCTTEDCVSGMCDYTPNDGASCDAGGGLPGECEAGGCVGLCEGQECTSDSECVEDGSCNDQTGNCNPGDNKPADTACAEDGGSVCDGAGTCVECNDNGQCEAGETCVENECQASIVDPPPTTTSIENACRLVGAGQNLITDIPVVVTLDPGPIQAGQDFELTAVSGVGDVTQSFLQAALFVVNSLTFACVEGTSQIVVGPRANVTGPELTIPLDPSTLDPNPGAPFCGAGTVGALPFPLDRNGLGYVNCYALNALGDDFDTDCNEAGTCFTTDPPTLIGNSGSETQGCGTGAPLVLGPAQINFGQATPESGTYTATGAAGELMCLADIGSNAVGATSETIFNLNVIFGSAAVDISCEPGVSDDLDDQNSFPIPDNQTACFEISP